MLNIPANLCHAMLCHMRQFTQKNIFFDLHDSCAKRLLILVEGVRIDSSSSSQFFTAPFFTIFSCTSNHRRNMDMNCPARASTAGLAIHGRGGAAWHSGTLWSSTQKPYGKVFLRVKCSGLLYDFKKLWWFCYTITSLAKII